MATRGAQVGNPRRLECEAAHGKHVTALARVLLRIAGMKTSRRKLTLHRESLRILTDERLARIAGGTEIIFVNRKAAADVVPPVDVLPRTNAWTTGIEYVC